MRPSFAAAIACLLFATSVLADDSITIWLKNGSMVRGELVERVPDDHITIKLATGEVRRVEWADVDHDSLGGKKKAEPKPEPAPDEVDDDAAHKPNPKAKAAADYVPPDVSSGGGGGEGAAVITGADGYQLQRLEATFTGSGSGGVRVAGEVWKTVCIAPCNEGLASGTYRIDGDGIPTSSSFSLRGGERIAVSPGNSVGYYGGRLLVTGGAMAAVFGGIVLASGNGDGVGVESVGHELLIGGLIGVAVGLPLWIFSRTTVNVGGSGLSLRPNGVAF